MTHSDPANDTSRTTDGRLTNQARRWRRRTTDLLAIGLLLVIGLAVGRQLTAWWNEPTFSETNPDLRSTIVGHGDAWESPAELQLGDLALTARRQQIHGDRETAWSEIESTVAQVALAAPWPSIEADQTERDLLQQLEEQVPTTRPDADTSLFRVNGPLPMIVARKQRQQVSRLIAWGLALPDMGDTWIAWVFSGALTKETAVEIPLPEQSRRLLSLRGTTAQQLVIFTGQPTGDAWWQHFQTELGQRGWETSGPPIRGNNGWTTRFRQAPGRNVVIITRCDNSGTWHGMLNLFTAPTTETTPETTPEEAKRKPQ